MGGSGTSADDEARPDPGDLDVRALDRVRRGDTRAFEELFERHVAGARRLARSMLRDHHAAEDAVAEAFTSTYAAIQRGRGPVDGFERYLRRSVRHQCLRTWRRQDRQRPTDDLTGGDEGRARPVQSDGVDQWLDVTLLRGAFRDLPARMQLVLWHTEVDGCSHAELAERLHASPGAIAALAMRSRRELARRYLERHVATTSQDDPGCRAVRTELAGLVRDHVSPRRQRALDEHLAACAACRAERSELELVNSRLRSMPLGAILATGKLSTFAGLAGRVGLAMGLAPVAAIVPAAVISLAVIVPTDAAPVAEGAAGPHPAAVPATTIGVDASRSTAPATPTPVTVAAPFVPTAFDLHVPEVEPLGVRPSGDGDDGAWAVPPSLAPLREGDLVGAIGPVVGAVDPVLAAAQPVLDAAAPVLATIVRPVTEPVVAPVVDLVEPVVAPAAEAVAPVVGVAPLDPVVDALSPIVDATDQITDGATDLLGL